MRGVLRRPRAVPMAAVAAVTLGHRRRRSRSARPRPSAADLPVHDLGTDRDAGDAVRAGHRGRRGRRQVPGRRGRLVTGIRFYKGTGNTGTHVGHLWTAAGTLLAHRDVHRRDGDRLAAGDLRLAGGRSRPNTTYVASYYAPVGRYAVDSRLLRRRPASTTRRCTRSRTASDGGNGVYRYGTGGGFPTSTYQSTNYWVDVVFDSRPAADTTATDRHRDQPGGRRDRRRRRPRR